MILSLSHYFLCLCSAKDTCLTLCDTAAVAQKATYPYQVMFKLREWSKAQEVNKWAWFNRLNEVGSES